MTAQQDAQAVSVTAPQPGTATPFPGAVPVRKPPRKVHLLGRDVTVLWPNRSDPRVKLFVIIVALQVLGQTVLNFKVSIAQILVTMGVCLALELGVFFFRDNLIAWPASALQTGNSVAFILRASGTEHGDWWSLNGIQYFILAAVLSLLSKYVIRPGGNHIFNPSNIGIVATLLIVGPRFTFPQPLWWGPLSWQVVAAIAVIVMGALWLLRKPVGMIPMAVSFLVPFYTFIGILALSGRSFIAAWHPTPISGFDYWVDICISPEVFIFVFFMMSDPRTAPRSARGRVIYGPAVAVVSTLLLAFQPTEFGVKLGILSGLTLVSGFVPLIEHVSRRITAMRARTPVATAPALPRPSLRSRLTTAVLTPAVVATVVIAVSAPAVTTSLVGNRVVVEVEQGIVNPQ
ncbi:MAG TPA: RnfABCDGE type electron transport complex subunit D [Candidatus Dormibacteraeota bacterium]|nr:RnfABCDGE type electron transport complex subunit D [Candidatus Dormibacteraeota bacterium]